MKASSAKSPMPKFKSWDSYWQFERRVRRSYRYVRSAEQEEFLQTVLATSKRRRTVIKKGEPLWRAQRGHGWRTDRREDGTEFKERVAHDPARMKPLEDRASEGRANPKGIPYLYLATTQEAAMSELRPWIGSLISVGSFKIVRDIKVVDCSRYHDQETFPFLWDEPEGALDPERTEKSVWTHIDHAFSKPVERSDDTADYAATQIIAELFKHESLDGVAYKSAFGEKGFNVCLFDPGAANMVSGHLFEVRSIKFDFEETYNPYYIKAEIAKWKRRKTNRAAQRDRSTVSPVRDAAGDVGKKDRKNRSGGSRS